ncbi:MAG: cob(I)yrinic acid a,c-diamide adenosyltransferase [Pirellulaceae bacterium]|nr:cob(I)yrinic acid a,c-diamide adenosyltransferase [Planctomycetales bacterium]
MKIYTKTGDSGTTGLFAGARVAKDDTRIECYGTVDELNAQLGWARALATTCPETAAKVAELDAILETTQGDLFAMGAELATPDPAERGMTWIGEAEIQRLEQWIDTLDAELPALTHFILPAGTTLATSIHVSRGVCRRAERRLVTLMACSTMSVREELLVYLNRLGDLLFVLARVANARAGQTECPWHPPARS